MNNGNIPVNSIYPTSGISSIYKFLFLGLLGTFLLAISSKIQVPFWPIPMTMQTFIVFLIGMMYGWKLATFTMLLYLFEGAIGIPVFAKGGGLTYLTGPTAGYLYGMTVAAGVIGFYSERGFSKSYLNCILPLVAGTVIIFIFGVGYLGYIIGFEKAVTVGLLPFISSELFKIFLAAILVPTIYRIY